jgi:D-glycero-D-manno-heptose 1,7-bisphosphate phosphatase
MLWAIAQGRSTIAFYSPDEWIVVGITNQGGVAAGRKSLSDCFDEQRYTLELFPQIAAIYFCPDEGKECWVVNRFSMPMSADSLGYEGQGFRKPEPGMPKLAMWQYDISPQHTFYVGSSPEDEEAAMKAGCNFMPADIWLDRFRTGVYKVNAPE